MNGVGLRREHEHQTSHNRWTDPDSHLSEDGNSSFDYVSQNALREPAYICESLSSTKRGDTYK